MGPDRLLFGTDGPIVLSDFSTKQWVQTIKNLPGSAPDGIAFTEKEVTGILGGNARKLLGL